MRERAEAATGGPWVADRRMVVAAPGPNAKYVADCFDEPVASDADAAHIASWHPAVALAVAKALDDVAHAWEIADEADDGYVYDADDNHWRFEETVDGGWLEVARAYLGNPT